MKPRLISIIILLLLSVATIADEGWLAKDAEFRIAVATRANTEARYFIPTPQPESDWQCTVFNADGAAGNAAAIMLDKKTLGFRVVIPPANENKQAFIYFSKAKGGEAATEDERPFKVMRNVLTVTTRAFTAIEMMGYFGEVQQSSQVSYVKNAGELPAIDKWQLPNKTHIAALLQWETLFILDKDEELSFGSNQLNIAWTMLVDGRPIANWHDSTPEKQGCFCAPLAVSKGIHTFQMIAIQRFGEQLPQAFIKNAEGIRQLQGVSAPDFPRSVAIEFSGKDKPAAKAIREAPKAYGSITTAKGDSMGNAVAFAKASAENAEFTDIEGRGLAISDSTLMWNATFMPGVRVGNLHFPARRRFLPSKQLFIRPRVTNAPNVIPFGKKLELDVWIDAANDADTILQNATAVLSYHDKDGKLDVQPVLVPLDGRRKFTMIAQSMSSFGDGGEASTNLANERIPNLIEINLYFLLNGSLQVAKPAMLRLVHPKEIGVSEVAPNGVMLTANGVTVNDDPIPATCVCAKLPKEHVAGRAATLGNASKVVLLDAFTENLFAPNAGTTLDTLLAAKLPSEIECSRIAVEKSAGTSYSTSMLATFGKIMAERPDIAILLSGAATPKGFGTPMEATAATLFMAQSCLAHGILPVLVAMPPLTGVDVASARSNALYMKEMATSLGVPVIDFYSMEIMGKLDSRQWYLLGNTTTSTPNDNAREWLAAQLATEIKEIINSYK